MPDYKSMSAHELTELIQEKLDSWQAWRERQLSLDAGWGMAGASVGRVYRPWLYSMSADFYPRARVHISGEEMDEFEEIAVSLAQEIYHAKYVDLHTMSGGNANSVLLCALTGKGDTIMAFEDPLGHRSMREDGIGGFIDRNYVPIPIDADNLSIDLEGFKKAAHEARPKLIMLGSAMYIFLEPFKEIVEVAREIGAIVSCDVSHTFGYLHCSMSVNPLDEGVDVILGGTYKTICGPTKGMICTNSEQISERLREVAPRMVFNYNACLIPALAQALIELRTYGNEYGNQMIKNARALGAAMKSDGFNMVGADRNYTDTHLLAAKMDGTDRKGIVQNLGAANILCSTVPCDESHFYLRPATMIVTRRGFVEKDMAVISKMLAEVIFNGNIEGVKKQVAEMMSAPERHVVHFSQM